MKTALKILKYIAIKVLLAAALLGIIFASFLSSMNTTNVYVLVTDAMKKRTDVILLSQEITSMNKYFTEEFMDTDNYGMLQQNYDNYIINNYGYKLNIKNSFVFPWQTSKTVTVQEAVYSIDGTLNTIKLPKEDAIRLGKLNPPEWRNSVYRVHLTNIKGAWKIDSIEIIGDFDYKQAVPRSLPPDILEALRPTPTPASTTTPAPTTPPATQLPFVNGIVSIINTNLNVRVGAGTNYKIISELKNGDIVQITGEEGSWYKIKLSDSQEGFVSKKFIIIE